MNEPSDAMKLHMAREVLNGWAEEEGLFHVYAMAVARAYLDLSKNLESSGAGEASKGAI